MQNIDKAYVSDDAVYMEEAKIHTANEPISQWDVTVYETIQDTSSEQCNNQALEFDMGIKRERPLKQNSRMICAIITIAVLVAIIMALVVVIVVNFYSAEKDVDECNSGPCLNDATCLTGHNQYTCTCASGWTGTKCSEDVDECNSSPCENNATCVNGRNQYICTCATGWTGTKCSEDIDECACSSCENNATCVNGRNEYTCTCARGWTGTNCEAAYNRSGIYTVTLWSSGQSIEVLCEMDTDGGGWTIFQNRHDGSVDFYRNFANYKNGFGNISGEFWLGLEYIQEIAAQGPTELRLDLSAVDDSRAYYIFQNFRLDEDTNYVLHIENETGTAGNRSVGLSYNNNSQFSTYDNDRDSWRTNCALGRLGGWWYNACSYVNLNGKYAVPGTSTSGYSGMVYASFKGLESLKTSRMMIRRVLN